MKKTFTVFVIVFLFFCNFTLQAQQYQNKQILTCYPNTVIDILNNTSSIPCDHSQITTTITNASRVGATVSIDGDNSIVYVPAIDFVGRDTLNCEVVCSSNTYTIQINITIVKCPDNIEAVECFTEPVLQNWGISATYSNEHNLSPYQSVVVGDIDGDGIVEIITATGLSDGDVNIPGLGNIIRPARQIAIYKGNNIQKPPFVFNTTQVFTWDIKLRYGIVKTKISNIDTVLIVVAEADRRMRAYNYNGQQVWETPFANPYHATLYNGVSPTFADLNHDGIPEIAISGSLYNSNDGSFICAIPTGSPFMEEELSLTVQLVDVFNDGNLKYVIGNNIYDVNIDPVTNIIQSLSLNKTIVPPTNWTQDPDYVALSGNILAYTSLFADIDGDGNLDMIILTSKHSSEYAILYVADIATGNIKAAKYIPNTYYCGYPFIGDVDGDGDVEITFIKGLNWVSNSPHNQIVCYKYISNNSVLQQIWALQHSDVSAITGLTLFDFDQDGIAEIVYRDETTLRIIDGRATSPYTNRTKASVPNYSGTSGEYPVIADIDGDGQAEIVIVGGSSVSDGRLYGRLWVYKSINPSDSPWAPARKVWNQFAYHPLNVNEDLTVPQYQMNPATFFPNGKQPYNNFLQQQTTLNTNGDPFWAVPVNVSITGSSTVYVGSTTQLSPTTGGTWTSNNPDVATVNNDGLVTGISSGQATFTFENSLHCTATTAIVTVLEQTIDIHEQILTCYPNTVIDILNNTSSIPCDHSQITTTIINASRVGATVSINSDNNNIVYTPAIDFVGRDTLNCEVVCSGNTYTIQINITIIKCPDNIDFADCVGTPEATEWSIKEVASLGTVSNYFPPLVGDMDRDGLPEIVVPYDHGTAITPISGMSTNGHRAQKISVFRGTNHSRINFQTVKPFHCYAPGMLGIVKTKINNTVLEIERDSAIIVVAEGDFYLRAYNMDGNLIWTSNAQWSIFNTFTGTGENWTSIHFADFNNDGYVEIYVGNRIFDAATGILLCQGTGNFGRDGVELIGTELTCPGDASFAADIDGDGFLELVTGNQIYKVNITNRTSETGNSITIAKQITPPACIEDPSQIINGDGFTQLIDIDGDGHLDVIVQKHTNTGKNFIYIWSPHREMVLAQLLVPSSNRISIPFIGDIDGCGTPEIIFNAGTFTDNTTNSTMFIHAYKYEEDNDVLQLFWKLSHTDRSLNTGLTLFDFNQDGIAEIIYRDETTLRIINGSGTGVDRNNNPNTINPITKVLTNYELTAPIACTSGTGYEFPVIADIDGDGQAEIIIAGNATGGGSNGALRIFKTNGSPWAPARPVWNQYMYNVVNVNDDLTVPQYQMNPATFFPNGKQPYNNFLQQQTTLNTNGDLFWAVPVNVSITGSSTIYVGSTTQLSPTTGGTWTSNNPDVATVNNDGLVTGISSGQATFTFENSLHCTATTAIVTVLEQTIDIHEQILTCYPNTVIDILNNTSSIPCNHSQITTTITNTSRVGATVSIDGDNNIVYTPAMDFVGRDTLNCEVVCLGMDLLVNIYITVVECPDNIEMVECFIEPEGFEWAIMEDFRSTETDVSTYIIPVVGDLDGDDIPEILVARYQGYYDNMNRLFKDIYVYWGHDRSNPTIIPTVQSCYVSTGFSVTRAKIGGIYRPIVVVYGIDGYLYAYNPDPAMTTELEARIWKSDQQVNNYSVPQRYAIGFADFDNDGETEVYAGNRIFDAATGRLIVDGQTDNKGIVPFDVPPNQFYVHFPAVADVTGNGKLEWIAGTQVYEVNIVDRNNPALNSFSIISEISPVNIVGSLNAKDGSTVVADINQDGRLDVIFVAKLNPSTYAIVAWDIQEQTVIAKGSGTTTNNGLGIPFIGKVDNEGDIKILLTSPYKINGFKWNGGQSFVKVYDYPTSDVSGATGITLFDFNQDGIAELVYRDETDLRILRAIPATLPAMGTFQNLQTIPAFSGTCFEYPIIVDVDNDGAAEIVTVGSVNSTTQTNQYGSLRIYKSGNQYPWAPARKVWNQYAYNVVNVNEDLTIPQYQMNPATFFPNGKQPYNNFLQQQTTLNINGDPFWSIFLEVSITGQDNICINSTTQLSPNSGGTWVSNNPTIATVTNDGLVTGISAGSTTFTFTSTTGCINTTNPVTINSFPNVTIIGEDDICIGETISLPSTTEGTWVSNNPNIANVTNNGIVTGISAGIATFTSSTDCFNPINPEYLITVNPFPEVSITGQNNICINSTTQILPNSGGIWISNNPTIATVTNNGIVTGISAGSTTFTFTSTVTNCSNTTNQITVNPFPEVSITGKDNICINSTTQLSPNSGGTWISNNPTIATVTNNGIVTGISAGSTTFTFTSAAGCSNTTNSVTVNSAPTVSITGDDVICEGAITQLSPSSGGTWASNNPSVASVTNEGLVTAISAGSATFTFTFTETGCTNTTSFVTIASATVAGKNNVCINENIILSGTPAGGIWEISNDNISIIGSESDNPITIKGIIYGQTSLTYTVNLGNCESTKTVIINVSTTSDVSISPVAPICHDSRYINLEANIQGGTWSGRGVSQQGVFDVFNAGIGTHKIIYSLNEDFCYSKDSIDIVVYSSYFEASETIYEAKCFGYPSSILINASGGVEPYTYSWRNNISETAFIDSLYAGTYYITITDANGCTFEMNKIEINEIDEDCINIPNAFTPNGDGTNDTWIIDGIEYYHNHEIMIFNRWGQKLYTGNINDSPWNGKYKDKDLPTGNYIYIVNLNNKRKRYSGIVTIVR